MPTNFNKYPVTPNKVDEDFRRPISFKSKHPRSTEALDAYEAREERKRLAEEDPLHE